MVVAETAVEDDLVPSFGLLTAMKVYDTVITLTKNPVIRYFHLSAVKNCIGTPFLYPLWLVPPTLTHAACHANTFLIEKNKRRKLIVTSQLLHYK